MKRRPGHDEREVEPQTARQVARKARRDAGDRSAEVAQRLMELKDYELTKLSLDEDLLAATKHARTVTAHGARRREERNLAGLLRREDLDELEARLAKVAEGAQLDARELHLAEGWRARLIEGEATVEAFIAAVPGADGGAITKLVEDARSERTIGKPRGAARALFRAIMAALKAVAGE